MRLESALLASREGITAHGQAISVIGDNIANANTTAFKVGRSEFDDLMAEAPGDRMAGVVAGAGDGVGVGVVRVIHENGLVEQTGRPLDVAIDGGGFFLVGDAGAPQFTRAGSFEIDKDGFLVAKNGLKVLGYAGEDATKLGPIDMYKVDTAGAETTEMKVYGNVDGGGPNVTVPDEPTSFRDINKLAAFSTAQSIYDSLGQNHDVQFSFFKTKNNNWTVQAYVGGEQTGGTAGTPVLLGSATLVFDGSGALPAANAADAVLTGKATWGNGAQPSSFTVDFSAFTQYSGEYRVANVAQDGKSAGNISTYEFGSNGEIYSVLDSGERAQVGTLPIATFSNLDGLNRSGSSTYSKTERAGETVIGRADSGARGSVKGQSLERSTVDIAQQFVELVVYQRGYQANSQALTAANELIQNTIGMLR